MEQNEIKISITGDSSGFVRETEKTKVYARDTKKELDKNAIIKYEMDVAVFQFKLDDARKKLRDAKKEGDKNATIKAQLEVNKLQSDVTEAKKILRDYVNTGEVGLSRFGRAFQVLGNTITGAFKQFVAFSGITAGFALVSQQFAKAQADAIAFESAFAGVKKTVDTSEQGYIALNNQLKELSKNLPVTYEELSKIAEAGGQLGVKAKDIATFTETVAKIAFTTNLTSEEAGTAFARIANVLQVPISKIGEMATVVVDLGNNFATTEREIVEFAQRIASGGAVAGVAKEDIFAIAAAFSSVGIEAEAGGTAVNKALLGLNEAVIKGGKELDGFAKVAGLTSAEFKTLFQEDAGQAFTKFVEGLTRSGDGAVTIIENLIGSDVRLKNAFLSVSAGGDILTEAMARANEEMRTQNALNDEAEKRFQTKESKIQMETNELRLQRAELIGNTAQWKIWAMERANNTFAWIDAIRKDYNQFVADGVGVARSINDITDGAKTQAEAMTLLQQEIQRVQDNYDRGRLSVEQYRNTMQELDTNVQQFTGGVQEELIQQLGNINQSFIDGSLTAGQYQTQILGVYSEAERLNVGLDRSTAITNGLSQIFKLMSTASSQNEIDALRKRADELTASANNALSVLNRLSGVKVTAPGVQKGPNITGEQVKQSLQQFIEVQKLQAKINSFSENYKEPPKPPKPPTSGGGGGSKKDIIKEAKENAKNEAKLIRDIQIEEAKLLIGDKEQYYSRLLTIKEEYDRKITEIDGKTNDELLREAEQFNKKILDDQKKSKDKQTENIRNQYREVSKEIQKSSEQIDKYKDKIDEIGKSRDDLGSRTKKTLRDLNAEMGEIIYDQEVDFARRFVEIEKEMSKSGLSGEEFSILQREKNFLLDKTTEKARVAAKEYDKLTDSEKKYLDFKKQESALLEQIAITQSFLKSNAVDDERITQIKDEMGVLKTYYKDEKDGLIEVQDLKNIQYAEDLISKQYNLQVQLEQTEESLQKEENLYKKLSDAKQEYEKEFTDVLGEEIEKQKEMYMSLQETILRTIELSRQALNASAGSGALSTTNIDNSKTTNQTITIKNESQLSAQTIANRLNPL